jgi:hypothetical protein
MLRYFIRVFALAANYTSCSSAALLGTEDGSKAKGATTLL